MAGLKDRLIQYILRGKDELSPEAKKSAAALESVTEEAARLGQALDDAKGAQGLGKALERAARDVGTAQRNLSQAEQQVVDLRDALNKEPEAAGLQQSLKDAERAARAARRQLNALEAELEGTDKAARAAGIDTGNLSDEHALYGDMSERVMTIIEGLVPALEVYSIDEAFAELTGIPGDLVPLGREIRAQVLAGTGIPTGVGIGPSKTLAKLANYAAKRWQKQTGGVVDIRDPERREKLLRAVSVSEVWGVGGRLTERLGAVGIRTAWDLAAADAWTLRKQFSVVLEKTARELRGTPCLELDGVAPPKQEICCSRMFGQRLTALSRIREAVASYAARASEKLRGQGSVCKRVRVSIRTGMFNPDEPKFARGMMCELPYPTDDTRVITHAALAALEQLYRAGFAFAKAEVLLVDLRQRGEYTDDLFAATQPAASEKVMAVLDTINTKWGRGTLRPGIVPVEPEWGMRRELLSQSFTTRLEHLWKVSAR